MNSQSKRRMEENGQSAQSGVAPTYLINNR